MDRPARVPRVRLEMSQDPDDHGLNPLRGFVFEQLPLWLLLAGHFTGRPDPRPIEDRGPIRVTRDTFGRVMREHRLRVELVLPVANRPRFELVIGDLDALAPSELAQRIAACAPLEGDELELALASVYADPRVAHLEAIWRSLFNLLERATSPDVGVEILNVDHDDLVLDFEDSRTIRQSGLWKATHQYNSLGMRPHAVVAIDLSIGARDSTLLRDLGEVARHTPVPILINAAEALWSSDGPTAPRAAWQADENAGFVALCAPRVTLRPAHAYPGRLCGGASFAAAALLVESFSRWLVGSHLSDADNRLEGVGLDPPLDHEQALAIAERGILTFAADDEGAWLPSDPSVSGRADLAWQFLLTRVVHQVHNIHYRKLLSRASDDELFSRLNAGLATRLAGLPIDARVEVQGRDPQIAGLLHLTLHLTVQVSPSESVQLAHPFVMDLRI